jgi:cholesterol transport system auxiliary component
MKKLLSFSIALLLAIGAAGLTGCATRADPATLYDLGPLWAEAGGNVTAGTGGTTAPGAAAASARLPALSVAEVNAPAWLDSSLMFFRLNYANDQQPRAYANSRWTMAPAQLFGQRLKSRLAQAGGIVLPAADGAANVPLLRIEADDFTQTFDSPAHSNAQIALRATVFNARTMTAQKTFVKQVPAPSADAAGGARALAEASDALIADMIAWLAALPLQK